MTGEMDNANGTGEDPRTGIRSLSRAVRQTMQSLGRAGVRRFPNAPECPAEAGRDGPALCASAPVPADDEGAPADKRSALDAVAADVARCVQCAQLADTRTCTVPGAGNPDAALVFVGEAPGADEDRQGIPFVGKAGQLLTRIIEACKLTRDDVFICNILKCRPPGNRNPLPTEVAHCAGYLHRQLEIIQPQFVCALGGVAAQALLDTTESVGRLRGTFHDYRGTRLIVTYHPAYLLRYPEHKRKTWDDMKRLMHELGVDL